jgi:hypothetical protein
VKVISTVVGAVGDWHCWYTKNKGSHVSALLHMKLSLNLTYLLTPWSRVLLEKLTNKLCS